MRFLNLRLQNFRNIEFAELSLDAPRTFLLGANGQGKSNILEALSLVTALRSFRTQNAGALPRKEAGQYALVYEVEHDEYGVTEIEIHGGREGRKLLVDGEPVMRLGDFIGRFPVVPLSSADFQLLRGSPAERRRFLDLTLSSIDRHYYDALRQYHRGITERNRLLKNGRSSAEFDAFEAEIATHAAVLSHKRTEGLARLGSVLKEVYTGLADADEGPEVVYSPNVEVKDASQFKDVLAASRKRDEIMGATQKGPHRDDMRLALNVGGAKEYASDGQQRGLCVALRIAQATLFREALQVAPVLLVDDVLGELDPHRKAGFWRACPGDLQIVATGTELPEDAPGWSVSRVKAGRLAPN
ncbi:DNA replication/repair protein RecF [Coraliomargarita sinensis]|nr:DNA replication and repair protein RecF [Coraliomargarita sinensis]